MKDSLKFMFILLIAGLVSAGMGLLLNILFPMPIEALIEVYKGVLMF